jgi:hypothetical protein
MAIGCFGKYSIFPMPEFAITVILVVYQKYFKEMIPPNLV